MYSYVDVDDDVSALALVSGSSALLLDPGVRPETVEHLWAVLRSGAPTRLVDEVTASPETHDFVLLAPAVGASGRIALAAGGRGRARLDDDAPFGGAIEPARTELLADSIRGAELRLRDPAPDDASRRFPILGGIVRCSALTWGEEPAATVAPLPESGAPEPAAPPPPVLSVTLPGGRAQAIDRDVLIGRQPSALTDSDDPRLITIDDEGKRLSRTHALLRPESDGVSVRDLGSTNGTILLRSSGRSLSLEPGSPELARSGDTIMLGPTIALMVAAG